MCHNQNGWPLACSLIFVNETFDLRVSMCMCLVWFGSVSLSVASNLIAGCNTRISSSSSIIMHVFRVYLFVIRLNCVNDRPVMCFNKTNNTVLTAFKHSIYSYFRSFVWPNQAGKQANNHLLALILLNTSNAACKWHRIKDRKHNLCTNWNIIFHGVL